MGRPRAQSHRRAEADDLDTSSVYGIASKEVLFEDTVDDHDRDVVLDRRWRYIQGSRARSSATAGFLAERAAVVLLPHTRASARRRAPEHLRAEGEAGPGIGTQLLHVAIGARIADDVCFDEGLYKL